MVKIIDDAIARYNTAIANHMPVILGGTPPGPPAPVHAFMTPPLPMVPPGGAVLSNAQRQLLGYIEREVGPDVYIDLRDPVVEMTTNMNINRPDEFDGMNSAAKIMTWNRHEIGAMFMTFIGFSLSGLAPMVANDMFNRIDRNSDMSDDHRQLAALATGVIVGAVGTLWAGVGVAAAANYIKANKLGPSYHTSRAGEYQGLISKKSALTQLPFLSFSIAHYVGEYAETSTKSSTHFGGLPAQPPVDYFHGTEFALKRAFIQAQAGAVATALLVGLSQLETHRPGNWVADPQKLNDVSKAYESIRGGGVKWITGVPTIAAKALASWAFDAFKPMLNLRTFPMIGGMVSKMAVANAASLAVTAGIYSAASGIAMQSKARTDRDMPQIYENPQLLTHELRQAGNITLIPFYMLRQAIQVNFLDPKKPESLTNMQAGALLNDGKHTAISEALGVAGMGPVAWAALAGGVNMADDLRLAANAVDAALRTPPATAAAPANTPAYQSFAAAKTAYFNAETAFVSNDYDAAIGHLNDMLAATQAMLADGTVAAHATNANLTNARTALNNLVTGAGTPHALSLGAFQAHPGGATMPNAASVAHDLLLAATATFNALPNATPAMRDAVECNLAANKINAAYTTALNTRNLMGPNIANPALPNNPVLQQTVANQMDVIMQAMQTIVIQADAIADNISVQGDPTKANLTNTLTRLKATLQEDRASATHAARTLSHTELVNTATALSAAGQSPISRALLAEIIEARLSLPHDDTQSLKGEKLVQVLRPILNADRARLGTGAVTVDNIKYKVLDHLDLIQLSRAASSLPANNANNAFKTQVLTLLHERIGSNARRPEGVPSTSDPRRPQGLPSSIPEHVKTDIVRPWLGELGNLNLGHQTQLANMVRDLVEDPARPQGAKDQTYGYFADHAPQMLPQLAGPIVTDHGPGFTLRGNN